MSEANNQLLSVENDSVQLDDNMVNDFDADRPPIISASVEDSPPPVTQVYTENTFQLDGSINVVNQMYEQNL